MDKRSQHEIVMQIVELVVELGWVTITPDMEKSVGSLIIGTPEEAEKIATSVYGPGFTMFDVDSEGNIIELEPQEKSTLH